MNSEQTQLIAEIEKHREQISDLVDTIKERQYVDGERHGDIHLIKIAKDSFEVGLMALERSVRTSKGYVGVSFDDERWFP